MKILTIEDADYINEITTKKHGGPHGIRDNGLIESSLNLGNATFFGDDLYESIEEKIATIAYSLIKNHGFQDGNKRVGCIALLTLCIINDIPIKPTQEALIKLGIGVASGELNKEDIVEFIRNNRL